MANLVCVLGPTGSGKSTSIKNLDPASTLILALKAIDKPLPFKGSRGMYSAEKKNYFALKDYQDIINYLTSASANLKHVKNIIIEDATYIMRTEFFDRSQEKSYDKFTDIADHFRRIIATSNSLRADLNIFLFLHTDTVENDGSITSYKVATVGKLLDKQYNPLESVTTTLAALPKYNEDGKPQYGFYTNRCLVNGVEVPAKSPDGMFSEIFIPNDLSIVAKAMEEYYK